MENLDLDTLAQLWPNKFGDLRWNWKWDLLCWGVWKAWENNETLFRIIKERDTISPFKFLRYKVSHLSYKFNILGIHRP